MEKKENIVIEVIAIGKELLKGDVINSNASYISKKLLENGYVTSKHISVSDDPLEIENILNESCKRADIVITTGGLGPTLDDVTKKTLSKVFNRKLVFSKDIESDLKKRYKNLSSIKEQSYVLSDSEVLKNEVGTAPGFIIKNKKIVIILPGVPPEMMHMFDKYVVQYLKTHFPMNEKVFRKMQSIALVSETEINELLEKHHSDEIDIGIYPSYGQVRVDLASKNEKLVNKCLDDLNKKFSNNLLPNNIYSLEEAIKSELIKNKKTLSIAESCTGGSISKVITSISGASEFFIGGIVSYSNEMKENILKVKKSTLMNKGAVSIETVTEMAKNISDITNSDYSIAVSGIAGPMGGSEDKPVGTVFVAIYEKGNEVDAGKIRAYGDRSNVIRYTVNMAMAILFLRISKKQKYFIK